MADAKLKYDGGEIKLGQGVTTLGRTNDNTAAFPHDSNVSRFHAEIEWRDGDFWLIDLRSSNGTKLNGEAVSRDRKLENGDEITLGGSSRLKFVTADAQTQDADSAIARDESKASDAPAESAEAIAPEASAAEQNPAKSRMPLMLGIAGGAVALAAICVVGAVVYSYSGGAKSGCQAKIVITKPENGDVLTAQTDIETESENAECVSRAIFTINGTEFADTTDQPFAATLDPARFPELADGNLQNLQILLEDEKGNKVVQPNGIGLQFDTIEIAAPSPTPADLVENPSPTPAKTNDAKVSGGDVQEMSKNLLKEFSGTFNYKFDPQFLAEVQRKTAGYATADGYFNRAAAYKDVISVAFVQEKNLDAPLGFMLAMSRSQFKPQKSAAGEGLWQMNPTFASEIGANGLCAAETLSDPAQNCAAKTAALYLKSLVTEVFEGDVVYSVAAFGKSPQEANIWKATLPADRADFWKIIRDPQQRENVVNFFAAAIVAENPQKFGLKNDRPIAELYKNLVGN